MSESNDDEAGRIVYSQEVGFFTIGHSTKSVEELVEQLKEHGVKTLVDVRTIPRSRTNPQHNRENLETALPSQGLRYHWLGKELGGLRKRNKELAEVNPGWYNASFQGYADYMQSPEFAAGLQKLLRLASHPGASPICLMCAETYYRQCHRALLSDALVAHGYTVRHITAPSKPAAPHETTHFIQIEKEKGEDGSEIIKITYPRYEGEEDEKEAKARKKAARKEDLDEKQPKISGYLKKHGTKRKKSDHE